MKRDSKPPNEGTTAGSTVGLISLGCPKNRVDSEIMLGQLERRGHRVVSDVEDAETVVVTLGSVAGTVKDTVDELREGGAKMGVVSLCSYRPFPLDQLRYALRGARKVVVLEKSLAVGFGGVVASDVRMALQGVDCHVHTVIAGLGGRPITRESLVRMFGRVERDELKDPHFLDLDLDVVRREIDRQRDQITAGPIAENILRELGPGVAKAV